MKRDISPRFVWSMKDAMIIEELMRYEGTPQAIVRFSEVCDRLSDYAYWFVLSTLWVSYTGWSDLELWRRLFSSQRSGRKQSIMKPSELQALENLPNVLTVFRAHREGETDWLSFTLSRDKAMMFAKKRKVNRFSQYRLDKRHVLALFTRRGEDEVLVLDHTAARYVRDWRIMSRENDAEPLHAPV